MTHPAENQSCNIGIAMVQWNQAEHTVSLLKSLVESQRFSRIVITDNNSSPDQLQLLQQESEKLIAQQANKATSITILVNSANSGFASAMNQSISRLIEDDVDWIWLLNNDVQLDAECIDAIGRELVSTEPGIAGCPMTEGGSPAFCGSIRFNRWTSLCTPIGSRAEAERIPQSKRYVSGANMLVHRNVFASAGLLNPDQFLYFEELDFVRRAIRQGFSQKILSSGMVYHMGAASSGDDQFRPRRIYHETWSTLYFYRRHEIWLFLPCLLFRTIARCLILVMTGRATLVKSVLAATRDFLQGKNVDAKPVQIVSTVELA